MSGESFHIDFGPPKMFTPYYSFATEQGRIGVTTCNVCGASIILDEKIDRPATHRAWHWSRNEGMGFV